MARRVFLLSPARLDGRRAEILLSERAAFPLAERLRREGATLGEVFAFLSGLYFRGKLTYATAFGCGPEGCAGAYVITSCRGLRLPSEPTTIGDLRELAATPIDPDEPRYREPLLRDARFVAEALEEEDEVVLLGSIATAKYVELLASAFGERLRFPAEFVGRGDMSRGGLLLRATAAGRELAYAPIAGAERRGRRPPRLGSIGSAVGPGSSRPGSDDLVGRTRSDLSASPDLTGTKRGRGKRHAASAARSRRRRA